MPPFLPDGLPFKLDIEVHPTEGKIVVDPRDNIDNADGGLNLTEATTTAVIPLLVW